MPNVTGVKVKASNGTKSSRSSKCTTFQKDIKQSLHHRLNVLPVAKVKVLGMQSGYLISNYY